MAAVSPNYLMLRFAGTDAKQIKAAIRKESVLSGDGLE